MKHFGKLLIVLGVFSRIRGDPSPVFDLASNEHASIDVDSITFSGFSSGAYLANTFHYVFSSIIKGCGEFAGGPFNGGYLFRALSASDLIEQTEPLESDGIIEPLSNLQNRKVYVYQGGRDKSSYSQKVVDIYTHFGADVEFLQLPDGGHFVPTDNFGGECTKYNSMYDGLNNCGVESIFEMFSHLYGEDFKEPASSSAKPTGKFYNFEQAPYTPSGSASTDYMNYHGGIYIPSRCANPSATCKLHVSLHGCKQSNFANKYYDRFAVHAGYLQVADENDVIVVFPRNDPEQLNGCWLLLGYDANYWVSLKEMQQFKSIMNILNEIIGFNLFV